MGIIASRSKVRFEIRVRVAACFIGNNVMRADRTNDCAVGGLYANSHATSSRDFRANNTIVGRGI